MFRKVEPKKVKPQQAADWNGPFPLPASLAEFYAFVGPAGAYLRGCGNDYFFPKLKGLWKYQEGYRWDGNTKKPVADWDDDWLVIADQGADPFILSRKTGKVLFANAGEGEWSPDEVFDNVAQMAVTLAAVSDLQSALWDQYEDDDADPDTAQRKAILDLLQPFYASREAAQKALEGQGVRL